MRNGDKEALTYTYDTATVHLVINGEIGKKGIRYFTRCGRSFISVSSDKKSGPKLVPRILRRPLRELNCLSCIKGVEIDEQRDDLPYLKP